MVLVTTIKLSFSSSFVVNKGKFYGEMNLLGFFFINLIFEICVNHLEWFVFEKLFSLWFLLSKKKKSRDRKDRSSIKELFPPLLDLDKW